MVAGKLLFFLISLEVGGVSLAIAAEKTASLFAEICSICHGAGGKGDGPSAAGLYPKPADFTDCKLMAGERDTTLFTIIKRGGAGVGRSTVMPSWGEALSDEQIRELVAFIRSLCKK